MLGAVLDGVPESMVIGLTLVEGGAIGVAYVTAVFLSNLPEGISAARGLTDSGWPRGRVLGLWGIIVGVMPEAHEHGGNRVGIATTLGFATAYAIHANA